jgi:hypothetical protein
MILVIILFVLPFKSFTQEQDSVVVPTMINGVANGAFSEFIMGDTTATGERAHPDAVYILKKDSVYICSFPIPINYDFTLAVKGNDPGVRPPMVVRGYDPQGALIRTFFHFTGDNIEVEFKDILFQGVKFDEVLEARGPSMMDFTGVGYRFVTENCVYNGWAGNNFNTRNSNFSVFILKNNIFRNAVGLDSPWGGSVYSSKRTHQDTVIFVNNTFFNISSYYFLSLTDDLIDYVEFVHNTVYNNTVNGLWAPDFVNAVITDNIFYNFQTCAQSDYEIASGYYDKHNEISSICKIYPLNETLLAEWGKSESERRVIYRNNVYAWSNGIKDYWANNKDELHDLPLIPPVWINNTAKGYFEDKDTYPHLVNADNVELDPGFDSAIMDEILTKEIPFLKLFRKYGHGGFADYAEDRYYNPEGAGKLFNLPWPLPEKLTYTNQDVMTHALGGYPAGDLNWFPDKKAEWEANPPSAIERDENIISPKEFSLMQNYPNPFNPSTKISFSIAESGKTTLSVYNVLGQKIVTLVDRNLPAGSYEYKFDGSNLTSGVYFYELQNGNQTQIKKMMLIK